MNFLDQSFIDAPQPTSQRVWSEFQEAVFDQTRNTSQALLINAVAGSGKTTTIIQAMNFTFGRSMFLAFNKSISLDIAAKAPGHTVKTLNALGHWQWMQNLPSSKLDAKKVQNILKTLIGEGEDFKTWGYTLARIVGLAKNCCFGLSTEPGPYYNCRDNRPPVFEVSVEDFVELMESYQVDIPYEDLPRWAEVCAKALVLSSNDWQTFDFDDQLYMPALAGWEYPSYDTVFVDESQDLSPIQHLMLSRLSQRGARLIAVGDRHQAIYGFRGALSNSMDLLKSRFSMLELPLSISYRCDNAIIREAQLYCPQIAAQPSADEGQVSLQSGDDPQLFTNQLVICRNNAPLFRAILRHYRAKAPCRILSNFLESFQGFIRGFKTTYTSDLRSKLDEWYRKEKESAEKRGFKGKLEFLRDKYETVILFCNEFKQTEDILRCIQQLGACQSGPTLSTIHKAKGLEAESVYFLRPDLCPSKWATSEEAKQQERNLAYVAITRAKHQLCYGAMEKK